MGMGFSELGLGLAESVEAIKWKVVAAVHCEGWWGVLRGQI